MPACGANGRLSDGLRGIAPFCMVDEARGAVARRIMLGWRMIGTGFLLAASLKEADVGVKWPPPVLMGGLPRPIGLPHGDVLAVYMGEAGYCGEAGY